MTIRLRSDKDIDPATLCRGTSRQSDGELALLKLKLGQRGLHDITNEMVFKSNPGFIFHDSRGFEAGGATELENVKVFIAERSKSEDIKNQVHAIWYVFRSGMYTS